MNKRGAFIATYIVDLLAWILFIVIAIVFFFLLKASESGIEVTIEGRERADATQLTLHQMLRAQIPDGFVATIPADWNVLKGELEKDPALLSGGTFGSFLQNAAGIEKRKREFMVRATATVLFDKQFTTGTGWSIQYPGSQPIIANFKGPIMAINEKIGIAQLPLPDGSIAEVRLFMEEAR